MSDTIKPEDVGLLSIVLVSFIDCEPIAHVVTEIDNEDKNNISYRGLSTLEYENARYFPQSFDHDQILKVLAPSSWLLDTLKALDAGVHISRL